MLSAVWDDGDDAHGWPRPTARWQGGCYCRCKAQRLLSPHALILILILISLAAPQAPTASTDPQHRHPCRRLLVACPLLQLRLQVQLPACARQAPVLFPPSPHLTSPSPRSPHCLGPSSTLGHDCLSMPLPGHPGSFLRLASCAMRLPAAASCCLQLLASAAALPCLTCTCSMRAPGHFFPYTLQRALCPAASHCCHQPARTVAACEPRYCPARPHIPHFHACPTSPHQQAPTHKQCTKRTPNVFCEAKWSQLRLSIKIAPARSDLRY
jgi:hypothetical protein